MCRRRRPARSTVRSRCSACWPRRARRWAAPRSQPLDRLTPGTIVEPSALRALLAEAGEDGSAVSRTERQEGAAAVASPVFDNHGVAGALCVCGPAYRFDEAAVARYQPLVRAAAAQLSRELGSR